MVRVTGGLAAFERSGAMPESSEQGKICCNRLNVELFCTACNSSGYSHVQTVLTAGDNTQRYGHQQQL